MLVLFVAFGAWQLSRTIVAVSSDPLRDLAFAPDPGKQPGLAGAFARGERVNLLLLGYGGPGHDGGYLTDTVMVASVDSKAGMATLISLPRDLWVTVPRGKYNAQLQAKVNEAFAIGANRNDRDEGMRLAAATVSEVVGLSIDRTIAADFTAFRTVVDKVGGIEVTVDRSFSSIYPAGDFDTSWIDVSFKAGLQHMDGETALRYSRARYALGPEGSDFARSSRQQKVILATRDKVVAVGAAQSLLGLLDALRDNVRTDLSLSDIGALGEFAKTYDDASTVRGALTNQNVLRDYVIQFADGSGYTLQPRMDGWSEVRAYVRRLTVDGRSVREDPTVAVQVSAKHAAVGQQAVDRLTELGITVGLEIVATEDAETTLITGGLPASIKFFEWYFSGRGVADDAGKVTIRLGLDWKPPRPFVSPFAAPAPAPVVPSPTATSSSSPQVRPSASPSRSPVASASPLAFPSPSRSPVVAIP